LAAAAGLAATGAGFAAGASAGAGLALAGFSAGSAAAGRGRTGKYKARGAHASGSHAIKLLGVHDVVADVSRCVSSQPQTALYRRASVGGATVGRPPRSTGVTLGSADVT
jgi:hypothetical protein